MSTCCCPDINGIENLVLLDTCSGNVDGYCFLLFEKNKKFPEIVAKIARTTPGKKIYNTEFENLQILENTGLNSPVQTVPKPLGKWEVDDVLITFQDALQGPLMKNVPGKIIFSSSNVLRNLSSVTKWLNTFQSNFGILQKKMTETFYKNTVLKSIYTFLNRYLISEADMKFLINRFEKKSSLQGQTIPFVVRHGDFCTANIIMQIDSIGVIDWEFALRPYFPLFDLFYFLSSVRYPFHGYQSESNHFDSFISVFWGRNYFNESVRMIIRETCETLGIPENIVHDFFLLSLIDVANMKYQRLEESNCVYWEIDSETIISEHEKIKRWEKLTGVEMDAPFARIRKGVFENIRFVVNKGFPDLF
ncbi:MAG: hypothetical protein A2161_00710 [Candidatus Schekmanbacteria bacterium RBG_13_48_7]|uniref:Aminoglycoside phosphotransferase domain-containing protein n=1 Tax=Candidatus Schekmanbacteria bacterium RBG_13_48_7 TaxID=1817878 RepID=A0A1F7RVZ6_9BACT|nr:MAG: hypothetical protein A2161_00710 [Candidatus Schekmanbacteria bacterium RBG_13_48_7]